MTGPGPPRHDDAKALRVCRVQGFIRLRFRAYRGVIGLGLRVYRTCCRAYFHRHIEGVCGLQMKVPFWGPYNTGGLYCLCIWENYFIGFSTPVLGVDV